MSSVYGYGGNYRPPEKAVVQPQKEKPPPMITHFLPGLMIGWLLSRLHAHQSRASDEGPEDSASENGGKRKGRKPLPRRADLPKGVVQKSGPSNAALPATFASDGQEMKMVLVVRQDLKMGGGKIAAQCSHAAVGTYHDLQRQNRALLSKWEACGQPKIVVLCKDMREMGQLEGKASRAGLPTHVITDAGRTQVAAGSKTVLAVGPGPKSVVDAVTGHLKLMS
ncbi:Peptidyl-tRNA hydrolase II (PTH2) family protein [Klebsormidium nitens]|uniref:peptidyl-tRNA hydrolase n=1 Tax=Klebsormidium nitens TaxID=105231 RepID=A0A1Y1I185_KLENI|nr:Peptidyl-tRNA hydrolase II (PTH2) family protein [Klebsormidium nitens]|eukprot:GAQ84675.1 Peptidyl-tRNA hydrolase II (PTH2) family protein [Klebsormidium nitens]